MERTLTISVSDAAHQLGIGRTKIFELLKTGQLPAVRIGGRTLIRSADLEKFVQGLPTTLGGGNAGR
jgi:excisionase family DNA binding protein